MEKSLKQDRQSLFLREKSTFFRQINVFNKEVTKESISRKYLSVIACYWTFPLSEICILWTFRQILIYISSYEYRFHGKFVKSKCCAYILMILIFQSNMTIFIRLPDIYAIIDFTKKLVKLKKTIIVLKGFIVLSSFQGWVVFERF